MNDTYIGHLKDLRRRFNNEIAKAEQEIANAEQSLALAKERKAYYTGRLKDINNQIRRQHGHEEEL